MKNPSCNPFGALGRAALTLAFAAALLPVPAFADPDSAADPAGTGSSASASTLQPLGRMVETERGPVFSLYDPSLLNPASGANALAALPDSYDLRTAGAGGASLSTSVKDQYPFGDCWSFGALSSLESNLLVTDHATGAPSSPDLAERHLAWFAYNGADDSADDSRWAGGDTFLNTTGRSDYDAGGARNLSAATLMRWYGAVDEQKAPYINDASMGAPDAALRTQSDVHVQNVMFLPEPNMYTWQEHEGGSPTLEHRRDPSAVDAIKTCLMENGVVDVSFYADNAITNNMTGRGTWNPATSAYFYSKTTDNAEMLANHEVSIIGWDDSFSRTNFSTQPEGDGAWIVKNSWGSVEEQFPNGGNWGLDGTGYFYLSYYDKSIQAPESFNFYTETYGQSADYYLINQYDYLPSDGVTTTSYEKPTSMANVFEAEEHQRVRSLSCETASPNTTATYELYLLNDGFSNPTDGKLLTKETVTYAYGGYHRLQLDEGFPIEQGQHFSVVVTLQCNDGYEVLVDRATNKNGMEADSHLYAVGVVNPGESYVNNDGTWDDWASCVEDIKAKAAQTPAGDIFDYDNFAIEAYADPMGAPPIHEAVVVPDLAGMTEAEALAALEEAGLRGEAGEPEYSDDVEVGRVLSQTTAAGTEVDKDYIVTYILSLGKNPSVVVPPTPAPGPDEEAGGSPGGKPGNPAPDAKSLVSTGDVTLPLVVTAAAVAVLGAVGAVTTLIVARKRTHRAHPRRR